MGDNQKRWGTLGSPTSPPSSTLQRHITFFPKFFFFKTYLLYYTHIIYNMYIRTLVFALFGNHKLKKVYKNKMFYGDFSNWSLPLSKACFVRGQSPQDCRLHGSGPASEQAHKHPPSILQIPFFLLRRAPLLFLF